MFYFDNILIKISLDIVFCVWGGRGFLWTISGYGWGSTPHNTAQLGILFCVLYYVMLVICIVIFY